jgi:hypothetical protein
MFDMGADVDLQQSFSKETSLLAYSAGLERAA